MTATISADGRDIAVDSDQTIESAARGIGLNPDAFLFLVSGRPVPMDTPVEDGMTVKAVRVASGG